MAIVEPPVDRSRPAGSRLLYRVDQWASRPLTALVVLAGVMTWVLVSLAAGIPSRWETVFQTLVAALTLTMVFVIQHTQAREQAATQRKLDEILQVLPGADNALLSLEHARAITTRRDRETTHQRGQGQWNVAQRDGKMLLDRNGQTANIAVTLVLALAANRIFGGFAGADEPAVRRQPAAPVRPAGRAAGRPLRRNRPGRPRGRAADRLQSNHRPADPAVLDRGLHRLHPDRRYRGSSVVRRPRLTGEAVTARTASQDLGTWESASR